MEKKNIDWSNIGFGYMKTDKRYVSNFKNGAWDEGTLTSDDQITISECAGVLQYAQTCFEGMKAYTTEDGHIVTFRPDLNASRMADSARRLEMPVYPEEKFVEAVENDPEVKIVGVSALLTTTMPAMKETVEALNESAVRDRFKIMVGGAPVTQEFADEIGADGYSEDAASAAALAKSLVA